MHTRFNGDELILVVEPGDQAKLPRLIERLSGEVELTFYTTIFREDIAGWLMNEELAVRIFGDNCPIVEVHLEPNYTRLRVYIPRRI